MRKLAALLAACVGTFVLGLPAVGHAQSLVYWQCAVPVSGVPMGGLCPVSAANPLPTTGGGGGGGGPATAALGSYVTGFSPDIGSSATTAWAGSGTPTVLGILQGIYNSSTGSTPAGTNNIGLTTPAPTNSSGGYSAVTVGASSAQALAASTAKVFLDLVNESSTATVACNIGGTAVINGAGSITLPPGWHRSWEGTYIPSDAINCIASAASTPFTVGAK